MIWSNLKENLCPKCSSHLEADGMLATEHTCSNHNCSFRIGDSKFTQIVNSQYRPQQRTTFDPDANLSELNNM